MATVLNDQDLSTYGVMQNLAWGGAVPALADSLGWDAQAVVSRVREGEGPSEPTRVYRLQGQLVQDGVVEFDRGLLEALAAEGADRVVEASLKMLAEVLRREIEVRFGPVPDDRTALQGEWVQTSVRVLVGDDSYEIAQYSRPTDVAELVRIFAEGDGQAAAAPPEPEAGGEELLPGNLVLPGDFDAAPAPPPPVRTAAETAATEAPVAYEQQAWPELPQQLPTVAQPATLSILYDVPLTVRAELGRTQRRVEEIITLGPGSVIDLDRMVGDPVDIYANDQWVARGEVVVVEENFGIRISEIGSAAERVSKLRLREGS